MKKNVCIILTSLKNRHSQVHDSQLPSILWPIMMANISTVMSLQGGGHLILFKYTGRPSYNLDGQQGNNSIAILLA